MTTFLSISLHCSLCVVPSVAAGVGLERDWYSQLTSVLNEIRGEIGATYRNNKEAKDRLLTSK